MGREGIEPSTLGLRDTQTELGLALASGVRSRDMRSDALRNAEFGTWFGTRFSGTTVGCPQRQLYTSRASLCMMASVERLNITLDEEQAEKLARLASRMHLQPGTIARSLLSVALDDADPDARNVADLLDGIPGALARGELGREQAAAGETISLDEL